MRKRIIAALLILLFILSMMGCSKDSKTTDGKANSDSGKNKKQTEEKMGRYMEHEVELPKLEGNEHIFKILRNQQQQYEVYTMNASNGKYSRYILGQDGSWKQDEAGWLNSQELKQLQITDLCLGQDGIYYASFQSYQGDMKSVIVKASEDLKTGEQLKAPYFDKVVQTVKDTEYRPMIQKIEVLKNGEFVLSDMWSGHAIVILTPDGDEADTIDTDQTMNYLAVGNNVIGMNNEGKIITYNSETKNIDQTMDFDGDDSTKVYAMKEDGTLIVGDSAGIHRLVPKGTLWETTVDGALNSMSMPSLTMDSLNVTGTATDEEYYVVYGDSESGLRLMHYVFNKNIPAVPEKEITVYSLNENKTIRQAISLYQSKNPDVKVNYMVAMGDQGGNVNDYIRSLNTELLSGTGADIIILDGLPVSSYIEKGVLADISDIVGKEYKNNTLLTNIINPYYKEGKTYDTPVRFGIPLRIGSKETLQATEQLSGLASYLNKSGKPFIPETSYALLLRDYLAVYFNDLCVNGVLEQGKLKEFLEVMKQLADNSKSSATLQQGMAFKDSDGNTNIIGADELFRNSVVGIKGCDTVTIQINNVFDTMIPNTLIRDNKLACVAPRQSFIPKGLVGLNKASKEPDIAKDFISFLFTPTVQDTNLYDGFPVNAASLQTWFDQENPDMYLSVGDDKGNMLAAGWPLKDERSVFRKIINEAKNPIEINQVLFDMIIESGTSYLSGDTDIDEATAEIMSKVNTYLAE